MNYSKLILVGCISAFVAVLTSVLGVAGTIIGSVISSVLYNMLSEALEKPVEKATFSSDFEWEIAYIFPLVVIILIQILLILALFSELGYLPYTFLKAYISLQGVAGNNLYRILGLALVIMSVYPFVLKPDFINKFHGVIIGFVGVIFLARGFVDYGNAITDLYDVIFINFDLPIAVLALTLLIYVVVKILISARNSENEFQIMKKNIKGETQYDHKVTRVTPKQSNKKVSPKKSDDVKEDVSQRRITKEYAAPSHNVRFKNSIDTDNSAPGINESADGIQFESNDLLDDYK